LKDTLTWLAVKSSFANVIYGRTFPVYAGAIPLDSSVLRLFSATNDIVPFVEHWTGMLLQYPRFAISWSLESCQESCDAYFLPGSLGQIVSPKSGMSWVSEKFSFDFDTVQVHQAPGIGLTFTQPPFEDFPPENCTAYYSETGADSLYLCGRQVGNSIAADKLPIHVVGI